RNVHLISEKEFYDLKLRADQGVHAYQMREKGKMKNRRIGEGRIMIYSVSYRNGRLCMLTVPDRFKSEETGSSRAGPLPDVKSDEFHKPEADYFSGEREYGIDTNVF